MQWTAHVNKLNENGMADRLVAALVMALIVATSALCFRLIFLPPLEAKVNPYGIQTLQAAAENERNVVQAERVSLRSWPGGFMLVWLSDADQPLMRLSFESGLEYDEQSIRFQPERSYIPEGIDTAPIVERLQAATSAGIWHWQRAESRAGLASRLDRRVMKSFLMLLAALWALVGLAAAWVLASAKWNRHDIWLLPLLLIAVAYTLWAEPIPFDIKLHFLPLDLGRGDLVGVYGFGFPGFEMLAAMLADQSPVSLYSAITVCGLLGLPLLYVITRQASGNRLYAWLLVLAVMSLPLWLRAIRSDSSHVAAWTALLTAVALLQQQTERWRYVKPLLAALALALAMMVRTEFVVLPVAGLLLFAAMNWRPAKGRLPLLLATAALILLLLPNYRWIVGALSWEAEDFLLPSQTLKAVVGISQGNLFFHPDFTPRAFMWFACFGWAMLLAKRHFFIAVSALLFPALFLFHEFTLKPTYQSAHYQFMAWMPYAALMAYGLLQLVKGFEWLKLPKLTIAVVLGLSLFAMITPSRYATLMSREPTTIHQEVSFFTDNLASFSDVGLVYAFQENNDSALKNPENLLHASGVSSVDFRYFNFGEEDRVEVSPGDWYYRGLACYTDPKLWNAKSCFRFEDKLTLQPLVTRLLGQRPYQNAGLPLPQVEIGLFRVLENEQEK